MSQSCLNQTSQSCSLLFPKLKTQLLNEELDMNPEDMKLDDCSARFWTFRAGVTVSSISADGTRGTTVLCSGFEIVDFRITNEASVSLIFSFVALNSRDYNLDASFLWPLICIMCLNSYPASFI